MVELQIKMILLFILQIAVRVPRLIAFFIIISYVPYSFSIVFNNLIFWVNFCMLFLYFYTYNIYVFHTLINFKYNKFHSSSLLLSSKESSLRLMTRTLKIIYLALEDKRWFDFCLDILSIWLCLKPPCCTI